MPAEVVQRLTRIGQIMIRARDLDRATSFYRDRLGLKHLFTVPGMAFFDCGGVRLMLGVAEKPEFDHPSSIIYFESPEIERAHQALAEQGVAFQQPPHKVADLGDGDLWLAFFRDSEENVMALMEEKRH